MSSPFSILSLKDSIKDQDGFSNKLGSNFSDCGFCGLVDHGIDQMLVKEVMDVFKSFCELPNEDKLKYFKPELGGARGYTPYKTETPKDSTTPDTKEFWHTGRSLPINHPYKKWMPDNFLVQEIPNFNEKANELYVQFDSLGKNLLRFIAIYLNLDEGFFNNCVSEGNSIMRPIHYPPVSIKEKGERAGAHEDINLITLLIGGHQSGLELLSRKGVWEKINLEGDVIICNIGDMLQRLTNHKMQSTTHRVTANPEETKSSRYSIPFFVHPNPDWYIETLPNCYSTENKNRYPEGIMAEDYLKKRLQEINLIK